MTDKCVCEHDSTNHNLGPIEKFHQSRIFLQPAENRINCKICECPKFKKKHFWSNPEPYDLRENEN